MLEPIEPTEGSDNNTPSDTLPPRRRRRAASRPAGPPAAVAETATGATAPAEGIVTPEASGVTSVRAPGAVRSYPHRAPGVRPGLVARAPVVAAPAIP